MSEEEQNKPEEAPQETPMDPGEEAPPPQENQEAEAPNQETEQKPANNDNGEVEGEGEAGEEGEVANDESQPVEGEIKEEGPEGESMLSVMGYYDEGLVKKMKKEQRDKKLAALGEKKKQMILTYNDNVKKLQEALADKKKIIYLDMCTNCEDHKWCTSHKQEKYLKFKTLLQNEVREK